MIVGPQHGSSLPRDLSVSNDKLELYAADTFFVESWEDLIEVAGDDAMNVAAVMAGLTLKPDAVVARVGKRALRWLWAEGFSVIAAERVLFDRRMIREIWRYAWNAATRDRKDVMDLLMSATPSLFIALRGPSPAAWRLSARKGAADRSNRATDDLREVLGAKTPLINFVHTTDEAADVIRELGVYFGAEARRRLYRAALAPPLDPAQVADVLAQIEESVPHHDLAVEGAVARVLRELSAHPRDQDGSRALDECLARVLDGEPVEWRTLDRLLHELRLPCSDWDRIVIACHAVQLDTPGAERLLPGVP